ncbi:MAG: hypothetical protein JWQ87_3929 [Candidatus Sulfotelmatobacter sp.]|nr:hypothetical protein [Candidatus Sulfotelmatobacter sp.]
MKVNPFQAERVESSHANLANFLEARLLTASEALNHLRELSREVGLSEVIAPTCPLSNDTHSNPLFNPLKLRVARICKGLGGP